MKVAAALVLLSAALHVVAVGIAAFAPNAMSMLGIAVVYVVLALGVLRGWVIAAWLSFFVMIFGTAGALAEAVGGSALPPWVFWSIAGVDLAAALAFFGVLWRGRPKAA
jgi:hypothetical protein